MARISYLLRRGASYYACLKISTDLVEILGKKELAPPRHERRKCNEAANRLVVEEWNRALSC